MGFIDSVSTRLRRRAGIGVERTYLYARDARGGAAPEIPSATGLRIARVGATELRSLATLGADDSAEWRKRLERGDECYGAWLEDALVHYSWVQNRGTHEITSAGIDMPIQPGELCIYNCRTSDAHRGMKIYPRMLSHILHERFAAGASVAWIYTAQQNIASQRGIERAGFTHVRTLRALRLGRMYKPLASDPAHTT